MSGFSRTSVQSAAAGIVLALLTPMHTGRPSRLPRFDYRGFHAYFLTFCTFQRRRLFVAAESVDLVRTQISRAATDESVAIVADCYMPDHLHLLVQGSAETADGRKFISCARQLSGFHYQRRFGERLWQRYAYERVLRADEAMASVARYIVENPIRAGLVRRVTEYPYTAVNGCTLEQILAAAELRSGQSTGRSG